MRTGEKVCSEGGGGNPGIQLPDGNAFDHQMASEEVVKIFLPRVGVCIWRLGATVESISSGEIGTRHWTGKQGAAAGVAAEQ